MTAPRGAVEALQRAGTLPATAKTTAVQSGAPAGVTSARTGAWRRQLVLNGWRLLLSVVLLAAWEVAATTVTTPFWISQPSRVFGRLVSLATSGLLFWHVWATLQAALLGLALG